VRFDDRRPGTDIDEKTILSDLSKMVPDADDRFRVEQLLFLEMQINNWVQFLEHKGNVLGKVAVIFIHSTYLYYSDTLL